MAHGHLALLTGDHEGALVAYQQALPEFEAAGDLLMQYDVLSNAAVTFDILERRTEAVTFLEQALRLCEANGERFSRRFALEFYGVALHRGDGRHQEQLTALRASLVAWPVVQPAHVAHTLFMIARTLAKLGDDSSAAVLLGARVRIWQDVGQGQAPYDDGFEGLEQQLKEALGDAPFRSAYDEGHAMTAEEAVRFALGEDAPRASGQPLVGENLSRRERQVAELVAGGLSNKEIAEQLVISPRTAEGHVAKVMDKLGVGSRAQIAAWVADHRA